MTRTNKFFWCPVCMIHTYHDQGEAGWTCINEDHDRLLQQRKDPWIEEYRERGDTAQVSLKEGSS